MPKNKRCPKCLAHPVLKRSEADYLLPAKSAAQSNSGENPPDWRAALPVQVYICPNCNLLELYCSPSP